MCTQIIGTGRFLPSRVITNTDLAAFIGKKDGDWIQQHLGIRQRRMLATLDPVSGRPDPVADPLVMAETSALRALSDANITADHLGGLWYITCTQPRDAMHFNAMVTELHQRLGLRPDAFALELDSGCGGVMQAIGIANDMIRGSGGDPVLIVADNLPSMFIDRDRYVEAGVWLGIYIFGDGAGSVILSPGVSSDQGILATYYGADGSHPLMFYHEKDGIPGPVYEIDNKAVTRAFPVLMQRSIQGLMRRYAFDLADVNRFYFHQANGRLLRELADTLQIPWDKIAMHVERYGNLASPTTLVLFDEDREAGRVGPGDLCLFVAMGAGAHYGAFLVRV